MSISVLSHVLMDVAEQGLDGGGLAVQHAGQVRVEGAAELVHAGLKGLPGLEGVVEVVLQQVDHQFPVRERLEMVDLRAGPKSWPFFLRGLQLLGLLLALLQLRRQLAYFIAVKLLIAPEFVQQTGNPVLQLFVLSSQALNFIRRLIELVLLVLETLEQRVHVDAVDAAILGVGLGRACSALLLKLTKIYIREIELFLNLHKLVEVDGQIGVVVAPQQVMEEVLHLIEHHPQFLVASRPGCHQLPVLDQQQLLHPLVPLADCGPERAQLIGQVGVLDGHQGQHRCEHAQIVRGHYKVQRLNYNVLAMKNSRSIKHLITHNSAHHRSTPDAPSAPPDTLDIAAFDLDDCPEQEPAPVNSMFTIRQEQSYEYDSEHGSQSRASRCNQSRIDYLSSIREGKQNIGWTSNAAVGEFGKCEASTQGDPLGLLSCNTDSSLWSSLHRISLNTLAPPQQQVQQQPLPPLPLQPSITMPSRQDKYQRLDRAGRRSHPLPVLLGVTEVSERAEESSRQGRRRGLRVLGREIR